MVSPLIPPLLTLIRQGSRKLWLCLESRPWGSVGQGAGVELRMRGSPSPPMGHCGRRPQQRWGTVVWRGLEGRAGRVWDVRLVKNKQLRSRGLQGNGSMEAVAGAGVGLWSGSERRGCAGGS